MRLKKAKCLVELRFDIGESRQNTSLWYLSLAYEFSAIKSGCKPRTAGHRLKLARYHFAGIFLEPSGVLRI